MAIGRSHSPAPTKRMIRDAFRMSIAEHVGRAAWKPSIDGKLAPSTTRTRFSARCGDIVAEVLAGMGPDIAIHMAHRQSRGSGRGTDGHRPSARGWSVSTPHGRSPSTKADPPPNSASGPPRRPASYIGWPCLVTHCRTTSSIAASSAHGPCWGWTSKGIGRPHAITPRHCPPSSPPCAPSSCIGGVWAAGRPSSGPWTMERVQTRPQRRPCRSSAGSTH